VRLAFQSIPAINVSVVLITPLAFGATVRA
jgi:hypothetical protein